jgi:hypothetical protein
VRASGALLEDDDEAVEEDAISKWASERAKRMFHGRVSGKLQRVEQAEGKHVVQESNRETESFLVKVAMDLQLETTETKKKRKKEEKKEKKKRKREKEEKKKDNKKKKRIEKEQ